MKGQYWFPLFLVIAVLGGLLAGQWLSSSEYSFLAGDQEVEETDILVESLEGELEAGTYFVFQTREVIDVGEDRAANDDTEENRFYALFAGEDEPVEFASIERGPEFSGGLTSYIYGQEILLHRYQTNRVYDPVTRRPTDGEELDGIMSLTGEIVDVVEENWGTIRSANGRYQVDWDSPYDEVDLSLSMTDLETGEVTKIDDALFALDESRWDYEPFLIDDEGAYMYVREICGCEAQLRGLWEVHVQTGEVRKISDLVEIQSWTMTSVNPDARTMIAIMTDEESSTEGPGTIVLPPSHVQLADLATGEVVTILEDRESTYASPHLDPVNATRFVAKKDGEWNLVSFDGEEIVHTPLGIEGWVMDWVHEWLVIYQWDQEKQQRTYYLMNVDTGVRERVEGLPGDPTYVGAITID